MFCTASSSSSTPVQVTLYSGGTITAWQALTDGSTEVARFTASGSYNIGATVYLIGLTSGATVFNGNNYAVYNTGSGWFEVAYTSSPYGPSSTNGLAISYPMTYQVQASSTSYVTYLCHE
jgi:hypothetical protein